MRDTELFQAALGLPSPWIVLRSEFDPDQKQLDLHIGFARGSRFACPAWGPEGCGVHDVRIPRMLSTRSRGSWAADASPTATLIQAFGASSRTRFLAESFRMLSPVIGS